jgi:hypothetical protein
MNRFKIALLGQGIAGNERAKPVPLCGVEAGERQLLKQRFEFVVREVDAHCG